MLTASHTGATFILACPQLFRCLTPLPDSLCSVLGSCTTKTSHCPGITVQGCVSAQQCQAVPWSCIPSISLQE